jgi:hypothetical protein
LMLMFLDVIEEERWNGGGECEQVRWLRDK